MTDFATIRKQKNSRGQRGCPVCGKPNVAVVVLQIRERVEKGLGKTVGTCSVSFCEEHGSELFLELAPLLEARRGGPDV